MSEGQSNRPKDHPLLQQRLSAWKPILTLKDAFIFFLITGLFVLMLGLVMFFTHQGIVDVTYDYTDCKSESGSNKCSDMIQKNISTPCICIINLNVTETIKKPVFIYYGLNGFYQNHRQYIKSFDNMQLFGSELDGNTDCEPFWKAPNNLPYVPCGAMANYIFNDTYKLELVKDSSGNEQVPLTAKGIALNSDLTRLQKISAEQWNKTVKPPWWSNSLQSNSFPTDEELLVWIRPSPLPSFKKLHRKLEPGSGTFKDGLVKGKYKVTVQYNYPVAGFSGRKSITLTNLGWLGGKNTAMSGLFMAVGALYLVISIVMLAIWLHGGDKKALLSSRNSIRGGSVSLSREFSSAGNVHRNSHIQTIQQTKL